MYCMIYLFARFTPETKLVVYPRFDYALQSNMQIQHETSLYDGRPRAGNFKSVRILIERFYHIKATAHAF